MKITVTLLSLFLFVNFLFAETPTKSYTTKRFSGSIKIDGIPDEEAWKDIPVVSDFIQHDPTEGILVTQKTEMRLTYDNSAIYISAMMYDTSPDSILHELGKRDEADNLNADEIRIGFDTYNSRQDGYIFRLSASGVQSEYRQSDPTYDAVWESAVHLLKNGWSAEIKIPYSALRFPKKEEQVWALQFARAIRRNREYDQWVLTPKSSQTPVVFWGTLYGISHIEEPLRLSLTPYVSLYTESSPATDANNKQIYQSSQSYSGGADIKYGIDERFTLDMTLLPDFSQVQSDNKVKNLTAFETVYQENRPFFKEGLELFSKGNLFYSRRIGATPSGFYDVPNQLSPGESIVENPDKVRLLNGVKLSGRTNKGLGIGVFNAVTANMYATIKDEAGNTRRVLTEPLANYNIFVLDQNLPHNSDVYVVNSNVTRSGNARNANVTTGVAAYETKKHILRFTGGYSLSQVFTNDLQPDSSFQKNTKKGNLYSLNIDKVSGAFQGGMYYEEADKNYDKNDLGRNFYKDYFSDGLYLNYSKNNPFWKVFKYGQAGINVNHNMMPETGTLTLLNFNGFIFLFFNNNYTINVNGGGNLVSGRDYYEPRVPDKFYVTPSSYNGALNFSTNYNKTLAFDFGGRTSGSTEISNHNIGYYIVPMIRFSDKWNLKISNFYDIYYNDRGWVDYLSDASQIIFGQRDIQTIENTATTRYLFKNDMALSISARHYWSKGQYHRFYTLRDDGMLSANDTYTGNHDFNTNFFNIDLSYSWQFAPGSSFIITYKNAIYRDPYPVDPAEFGYKYYGTLKNTVNSPQTNSVSLKVLYYLDYQYFKKKA